MPFDPSAARSGAVTSDNPSFRGGWLCYINGIEVPIIGFSVTGGVWQIPQFQIQLAPDPDIEDLGKEDRVQVALFYLDQHVDPVHPEWRLLVDGEIIGRGGRHAPGARSISFTCLANIQVFKQLYFFFMNTVDDIVAAQSPEVASAGLTSAGLFYPYSLFHQGLLAPRGTGEVEGEGAQAREDVVGEDDTNTVADDVIKAPYELVYNVVRGIIDKNADPENKHRSVPMMNFFARYVRKTRLHNRFVRLPFLEDIDALNNRKGVFPIFNAARNDEALSAMQRETAKISNSGTVWNILEQTLGTVYMEIGMVPNPACVVTNLQGEILTLLDGSVASTNQSLGPSDKGDGNPAFGPPPAPSVGVDSKTPVRLAQYFVKPQFLFGTAPMCNVFYPSMILDWSDDENFIEQPTRTYVNDSVMTRLLRGSGANREFMLHALTVAYPEEADAVLHHHISGEDDGAGAGGSHETGKDLLIPYEELFKGPVVRKMELPSWFQMLVQTMNSGTGPDARPATPTPTPVGPTPRQVRQAPGVGDSQTGANTPQEAPQLPPLVPRGRPGGAQYWPNAYRPSAAVESRAASLALRSDTMPTVDAIRGSLRPDGNYQAPVYRGVVTLARYLRRQFPDKVSRFEMVSGYPTDYRTQSGTTKIDPHKAGRAVDLYIPTLRGGQPNLELGNVVANWLAEHAQEIGVQYFIWARTQFTVDRGGRGKFTPYTRSDGVSSPHVARFDHFNHIHLELNLPGCRMETPFFLQNGGANEPTEIANANVVTPRAQTNASSQQEIRTQVSGPRPESAPVTTVTRPATTVRTYTNEGGEEPTRPQSFQRLFRLYAQYEYLRARYMQRTAGVMLIFNPYVLAGFPCVILDAPRTSSHRMAYVMQYTHTASAQGSWNTQVSVACVRTFREFLNDVKNDCDRFAEKVASAPAEIIPEIRRVIQDNAKSELFYQRFLHGGSRPNNWPAAFHYEEALGYQVGNEYERINVTGESVDSAASIREAADAEALAEQVQSIDPTANVNAQNATSSRVGTLTVSHNIDPNRPLQVLPDTIHSDCFDRADSAFQMVARPACTLTQYIRFWHAGLALGECVAKGHVEGEETDFTYLGIQEQDVRGSSGQLQSVLRQSAGYWRRIYKLRQGPGELPSENQRGYVTSPPGPSQTRQGLPGNYPETRADWDTILLNYRDKIRTRLSSEE